MNDGHSSSEDFSRTGAPRGSACCSNYVLPPLLILVIAAAALLVAFRSPTVLPSPAVAGSANTLPTEISSVFTAEIQHWGRAITRWASESGIDPNLVAVVMQIESCGDPRALSRAGAIGLFQVMPYHFAETEEPYSPDINAARGIAYLHRALAAAQGDARLALAGYNGGIGVIGRPDSAWPAETVRYAYWGSGIYDDARTGSAASPRLEEWLAVGGSSLCGRARQRLQLED